MRRTSVTTVAVVVLVVLAGCAGLGTSDGPDPTAGTDTAPGPTPSVTAPAPTTTGGAPGNGTLEVHVLNVGQGASALVVGPTGETMLVDTGDFKDDGEVVLAYLERLGVERIDYLVTTHADADHIGGHAAVIEHFETEGEGVGAVYDPGIAASTATYGRYLDAVERYDVPLYRTAAGDRIPLAGASVRVLAPPEDPLAGGERNENSVVLRVVHGEAAVLLPGDAESAAESFLLSRYGDGLRSTVLLAGHHGSRTSTSAALLDAVRPRAVVVSSAYDSRFGHPHPELLDRLATRSLPTYWTGTHGTVVVASNGTAVRVGTQRTAPTDPGSLRDATAVEPGTLAPALPRASYPATAGGDGGGGPGDPGDVAGALAVSTIHADAAGDDRANLGDEYVVLTNERESALDLSGWVVSDESGRVYRVPPGVTLPPGGSVTLYTGAGADTATALYWDAGRPVWNNDGDTVTVRTAAGRLVVEVTY